MNIDNITDWQNISILRLSGAWQLGQRLIKAIKFFNENKTLFPNTAVIFKDRQEIADNHSETLLPIRRIFFLVELERSAA